jgi:hypothetical protein
MWGMIIASLIVVSILLTILDSVTRRARIRAQERQKGIERSKVWAWQG